MTPPPVDVTLAVSASERELIATLRFTNKTTSAAFVDRIKGCVSGELEADVFVVLPTDAPKAQPLTYLGPRGKRRKPLLQDFVRLEPGASFEAKVRLDKTYAFPAGHRDYKITYTALHQYPQNDDYWEVSSNDAMVGFPK
jgi:hypothetical protein